MTRAQYKWREGDNELLKHIAVLHEKATLWKLMREGRAKTGWSLTVAAKHLGCSKAHLHALESGESKNPCLDLVRSVRGLYGVCLVTGRHIV